MLASHERVRQLLVKHGLTFQRTKTWKEAQVLLCWVIQKEYPVLPKSTNPERIRKNADIFGFTIDDEDMAAIEKMDRGDGVAWAMDDPTKAP